MRESFVQFFGKKRRNNGIFRHFFSKTVARGINYEASCSDASKFMVYERLFAKKQNTNPTKDNKMTRN